MMYYNVLIIEIVLNTYYIVLFNIQFLRSGLVPSFWVPLDDVVLFIIVPVPPVAEGTKPEVQYFIFAGGGPAGGSIYFSVEYL